MSIALILSILILLCAPLLARVAHNVPMVKSTLDGFVLMSVIGIVTLTLLPEALNHGRLISIALLAAGFAAPWIAELLFHKEEERTHRVILLVAVLALVVHTASDGAILALAAGSDNSHFIASGVLLHRLGVAITIWWLLAPMISTGFGFVIMLALAVTTLIGYFVATLAGAWYDIPLMGYWQAFAAGSLMHVVLHPLTECDSMTKESTVRSHRFGTFLGLLFIISMALSHLTPFEPDHTNVHAGLTHDMIQMLNEGGQHFAPILLLLLGIGALVGRLRDPSTKGVISGLTKAAPWSLILWFVASIGLDYFPITSTPDIHNNLTFPLYLAIMGVSLVTIGAPRFFAAIIPGLSHHHHHKHNHGHTH